MTLSNFIKNLICIATIAIALISNSCTLDKSRSDISRNTYNSSNYKQYNKPKDKKISTLNINNYDKNGRWFLTNDENSKVWLSNYDINDLELPYETIIEWNGEVNKSREANGKGTLTLLDYGCKKFKTKLQCNMIGGRIDGNAYGVGCDNLTISFNYINGLRNGRQFIKTPKGSTLNFFCKNDKKHGLYTMIIDGRVTKKIEYNQGNIEKEYKTTEGSNSSKRNYSSGSLLDDIFDFIEEHPIATAIGIAAGAYLLSDDDDSTSNNRYSWCNGGDGSLHINTERKTWLANFTVQKFSVEIQGDESTGFRNQKDESGNGFFQSGYTSFYSLCAGNYNITITGYDKYESLFSFTTSFQHPGTGDYYCNANINDKTMRCNCR